MKTGSFKNKQLKKKLKPPTIQVINPVIKNI
jgi:hypothetical protein